MGRPVRFPPSSVQHVHRVSQADLDPDRPDCRGRGGPEGPAGIPPPVAARLADDLHLDAAQRAQFRHVLEEHRAKYEQVHREARDRFDAAICCGTSAVYRRTALEPQGGPTLIPYAEDVHTGLDVRRNGWSMVYLPVNLSTGICPDNLDAFVRQPAGDYQPGQFG